MQTIRKFAAASMLAALSAGSTAQADGTVEVLHWWTSGGEAKAVGTLKEAFEAQGGTWNDSPIAGGGGDARSRSACPLSPRTQGSRAGLKNPDGRIFREIKNLPRLGPDLLARREAW